MAHPIPYVGKHLALYRKTLLVHSLTNEVAILQSEHHIRSVCQLL